MRIGKRCLVLTTVVFFTATGCQKQNQTDDSHQRPLSLKNKDAHSQIKPGPNEAMLQIQAEFIFVAVVNGIFHPKNDDITIKLPTGPASIAIFPENGPPRFIQKQLQGQTIEKITLNKATPDKDPTWERLQGFGNVKLWVRHSLICLEQKQHQMAKVLLKAALRQFPKHGPLWKLQAQNYNSMKKYEAALNAIDRYLELTPQLAEDDAMRVLRRELATRMDDSRTVP